MAPRRRYSTALRAEQTALTRRRILDAAYRLFVERGYPRTTVGAVAEAAGVSVQTVYNVVGGKAVLLRAVFEGAFVGDGKPPTPVERLPAFRAIVEAPTGRACLAAYAAFARMVGERLLPLTKVVVALAATGDADVSAFVARVEGERAAGSRRIAWRVGVRRSCSPLLALASTCSGRMPIAVMCSATRCCRCCSMRRATPALRC